MPPRVLFLHANGEDYLSDSLLHGLRTVLGEFAVDVPRRDALYEDLKEARRDRLYGRGFTLYGRLPELEVDREWPIQRALEGEFEIVVIADIHRNWSPWVRLRPLLRRLRANGTTLVALDGGDSAVMYPYGPTWWRQMRPWPLPRAHRRILFYKRELQPLTARIRYFGLLPGGLALRLLSRSVRPIAFSIPEEHLATGEKEKTKLLATHAVDPEVANAVEGAVERYAFSSEADYYRDLRASRFGVTTRKAGWDCMRHYELAASGCVPCFRDLHRKPPSAGPHGLDESNCVPYGDARELLDRIERIEEAEYERLRQGALRWARENTTVQRARELLAEAQGSPDS
ncbi:MAG: glycosyltransferase [Solirubrobacterales bacterium]